MGAPVVLVAYASETGSTARIAGHIATVLRAAGLDVESRLAADVDALVPYDALVLGSGMYVRSRHSDGGGFLSRHARGVAGMPVWLFCAGPIGRGGGNGTGGDARDAACTVMDVARAVGARGAAAFGCAADSLEDDLVDPVDVSHVRAWAHEIAAGLREPPPEVVTA